jgi:serine protease Do
MQKRTTGLVLMAFGAVVFLAGGSLAGVLKSLDQELKSLVEFTEPYLVTVKGTGGLRNLVATGIMYDDRGHVITSSQVLAASGFNITFKNGRSYAAEKIGVDYFSGLGVLKIHGHEFPIQSWKSPKPLQTGAWVTLVGNSYETPATISFGTFVDSTDEGLLKLSLDAAPGSSGGALLNIDGEIVGVLVARESGNGDLWTVEALTQTSTTPNALAYLDRVSKGRSYSYAVPFESARQIAEQIIVHGKVSRGFLGVSAQNIVSSQVADLNVKDGVKVIEIEPGSPADSAGIMKEDIITGIDSRPVRERASLYALIRARKPGEQIKIVILRDKRKLELTARLVEAKDDSFFGNMRGMPSTISKAFNKLSRSGKEDLAAELDKLREQVTRLQSQVADLQKKTGN